MCRALCVRKSHLVSSCQVEDTASLLPIRLELLGSVLLKESLGMVCLMCRLVFLLERLLGWV